jgi:RNA polymerase sigma-70 factor (ECF subfamily)
MTYISDVPGGRSGGPLPGTTSTGLLERLRVQDTGAWDRLAQLYGPLVYRWARGRGLQAADAENIVQDVFLAVLGGIASFRKHRPGDSFRGWLWGITYHKLLDFWRRQEGEVLGGGSSAREWLARLPAPSTSSSAEAEPQAALGGLYRRALELVRGEFEERSWRAFWGVVVEGRDTAAVAANLGMTPNAVRIAKARILGRLRAELGELLE